MTDWIQPLSSLGSKDVGTAGGKGANLGELLSAGLPVPSGFVVTTAAYNEVAASLPSENGTLQQSAIPEALVAAIEKAYQEQLNDTPVAVRSSGTAEDQPDASFAGQHDTLLNVQNKNDVLDAIKTCWASGSTERAIAYRQQHGIANCRMAVVVQAMVPDVLASGVLFTSAVSYREEEDMLINAAWGLGEAMVSGKVTPDAIRVDKQTLEILQRETETKTVMTVLDRDTTREEAVPIEQQDQPVLTDEQVKALAKLGRQVEEHYSGTPMDMEWAVSKDGTMYILQARPITSPLPPPPAVWEPVVPNTVWLRRQIVEFMPEPLSPLFEDVYLKKGIDHTMDLLMDDMSKLIGETLDMDAVMPQGFAATIHGYAYTGGTMKITLHTGLTILKMYAKLPRYWSAREFDYHGFVLPNYKALIDRWQKVFDDKKNDYSIMLQGIRELATADSHYWFGSAAHIAPGRLMEPGWEWLLRFWLVRYAVPKNTTASLLLRGFESKAVEAQAVLEDMAASIRSSPELCDKVTVSPPEKLVEVISSHLLVKDSFETYLKDYGHQFYNLDFCARTSGEDPLPILLSLKALVTNPPQQDARTRQAAIAQERDALVETILSNLRWNFVGRWIVGLFWRWTQACGSNREQVMFYLGAACPTVRQLAHRLGQRLVELGTVTDPDDVYYLTSKEIDDALVGKGPSLVKSVQQRRSLRQRRQQLTPPPKVPQASLFKIGPFDLSMFEPTPSGATNFGHVLTGYAVSAGKVTAVASVITCAEEFPQMKPNTILVCTSTTPAWTPLFSQAVGLVTDVGGALAHGSLVAREYGLPAVMGTGVATQRIRSGDRLLIDGAAGTVTLLDEVDEKELETSLAKPRTWRKTGFAVLVVAAAAGYALWRNERH